jgi:hypothetical protein
MKISVDIKRVLSGSRKSIDGYSMHFENNECRIQPRHMWENFQAEGRTEIGTARFLR